MQILAPQLLARECLRSFKVKWEGMKLKESHLRTLNMPFSNEEIKTVALSIASNKSPGPDDIPGAVFHKLWDPMSKEILEGVYNFFNNGKLAIS